MPRNQSTASQRARAKQRETGGKYTTALREATKAGQSPKEFTFRELLAECTTLPQYTGGHPDIHDEWAPRMFDSALLGGPVPYSTVLYLAGALAGADLNAPMRMESHRRFSSVIVACNGRRFELILTQDDLVYELCLVPGCGYQPVAAPYIPYCAHRHLAERSESELVGMASVWGYDRHQEYDHSPASVHPGYEGDRLIASAVAQGTFTKVATTLVEACYEDPDLIDEVHGFGEMAVAVRHAMDREFLRLEKVAQSAAAHIHKLAGGSCVSCGGALFLSPLANVPARFCSAGCAAGSSQDSSAATSPKE